MRIHRLRVRARRAAVLTVLLQVALPNSLGWATAAVAAQVLPAPVITAPSSGATVLTAQPTFAGTGLADATVTVVDGTTTLCSAVVVAAGTWSCTPVAPSTDGLHTVTAAQATSTGDTSPASAPVSFTIVTGQPLPPVVSSPSQGSVVVTARPQVSGTGEPNANVTVRDNGTPICDAAVDATGRWACTPAVALANGPHSVTADQTDMTGNTSPESSPVHFTVSPAPSASPTITSPSDGQFVATAQPTFTGTGIATAALSVVEGTTTVCTAVVVTAATWSCTPTTPLLDGLHTITARQTPPGGDTSLPSSPVTFTTDTGQPVAPVITTPVAGSTVTTRTPSVSGTGEPRANVTLRDNGTPICTAAVSLTGRWSCTPSTPLADGAHRLSADQYDLTGNLSPESVVVPITVRVDTSAGGTPTPSASGLPTLTPTPTPTPVAATSTPTGAAYAGSLLAATGFDASGALGLALLFLAGGVVLVWGARRHG
jgi:hypothetical protein